MSKTLLTRDNFSKNPKELFTAIENKYFFGRAKNGRASIEPYFIITDGEDVLIFDNGINKTLGFSLTFYKRPGFFSCRFWNKGPASFSKMMKKIVRLSFDEVCEFVKGKENADKIEIIETLTAVYTIDKKRVLPIYIVQLPYGTPLQMNFAFEGNMTIMSLNDFTISASTGNGTFDTITTAIAYLMAMDEIIIPKKIEGSINE